jgi:hypothetical protein
MDQLRPYLGKKLNTTWPQPCEELDLAQQHKDIVQGTIRWARELDGWLKIDGKGITNLIVVANLAQRLHWWQSYGLPHYTFKKGMAPTQVIVAKNFNLEHTLQHNRVLI